MKIMFYVQNISIYMNLGWGMGVMYIFHRTFFVYYSKNRKSTRAWPILKSNSISFRFTFFFLGWIIKILRKGAPGGPCYFLYEVSIVVLIDFIAILLPPLIFVIQIVNTNMYLIHFHSKTNIQLRFPQSWVFKVSNQSQSLNFYLRMKTKKPFCCELYALQCISTWFSKKQLN